MHGTVTAVGASSVTIKTSSGTATYSVTSSSDIDKNGKTTLSALAVGDNVAFSTVTTNGSSAIDTLYAGNAAVEHGRRVHPRCGTEWVERRQRSTSDRVGKFHRVDQLE